MMGREKVGEGFIFGAPPSRSRPVTLH